VSASYRTARLVSRTGFVFALVAAGTIGTSCNGKSSPSPAASSNSIGDLPQGATAPALNAAVLLPQPSGPSLRVRVEIADSPSERERGLMFRQTMEADAGMLFLFPAERQHGFWMKNTYIPLDMIFIRSDFSIAGIVENAEPMTLTSRGVPEFSQYVLEVNGGYSAAHGISKGMVLAFDGVPPVPNE
jgi:uncharacterized membrane protein (UPF0127 family)